MEHPDSIFNQIRDFSEATARNTEFGPIDNELYWFAKISCVIAIVAFVISIVALYFNIRTLRSQERTERNTRLISERERLDQLLSLLQKMFQNIALLIALLYKSKAAQFKKRPAPWHFEDLKINESLLTVDSFWDNEEISRGIVNFSQAISGYNHSVLQLAEIEASGVAGAVKDRAYKGMIRGSIRFYKSLLAFLNAHFLKFLNNDNFKGSNIDGVDISEAKNYIVLIENGILLGMADKQTYCDFTPVEGASSVDFKLNLKDLLDNAGYELYLEVINRTCGKKFSTLTPHDQIVCWLQQYLETNSISGDHITMID